MADNTFLGLQPYTEDDAYRFKGRAEESQELFRLIVRNDFTVCYAESGEGKTSLLNAGVFPLLRENMYFPIAITFTSDDYKITPDSFDAIIDRCIKDSITEYNKKNKGVNVEYKLCSTDFQGLDSQTELQRELSKYTWWKLRNYRPQAMGLTFTPVFVFDQFEEVFNLPGSIVWTKKFFDWLEDVSSDSCPDTIVEIVREIIGDKAVFPIIKEEKGFKAIFSLRKEFIGELDYWGMQTHFIPALKDNRYCLKALTYEGAKKVMTQQERFDESKVEQILTYFVSEYSRESEKTIDEKLPVIPALLLSVVCGSWEKDIDTFAKLSATEIGQSLNSILECFYNQTIETIVQNLSEQDLNVNPEQHHYDLDTAVFALVDSNGKRIRTKTTTSTLAQIDFDNKFKKILRDNRIIKVSKIDHEDYVEIVHDALCPVVSKKKEERLASENREREELRLLERTRQIRRRMKIYSLFSFVAIIIICFMMYQINETRKAVKIAQEAKNEVLEKQAMAVAEKSRNLVDNGDSYLAQTILCQLIKEDCPIIPEIESALRYASKYNTAILRDIADVKSVSFSPDGTRIASSNRNGDILIWDASNGQCLKRFGGNGRLATGICFSPSGDVVAVGSNDGYIRIYDAVKYFLKDSVNTKQYYPWALTFSRNGKHLISGTSDGVLRFWNTKDYSLSYTSKDKHNSLIEEISLNSKGDKIVSASWDKTIKIWDYATGNLIQTLNGHKGDVKSVKYSIDGKYLVSGSADGSIRIWDTSKYVCIDSLYGHNDYVESVCFDHSGTHVISASADHVIKIWEIASSHCVKEFLGHERLINQIVFSPDGKLLCSISNDNTIRIWDYDVISGYNKMSFNIISRSIATSSKDMKVAILGKQIKLIDLTSMKQSLLDDNSSLFTFNPDGNRLLTVGSNSRIWDVQNAKCIKTFSGYHDCKNVNYSTDGKFFIVATGHFAEIRNAETGENVITLGTHNNVVQYAVYNPKGTIVATSSDDIKLWDSKTGRLIDSIPSIGHYIPCIHFSPDGEFMVASSFDGTVRVYRTNPLQLYKKYEEHTDYVDYADFLKDGKKIITVSYDNSIIIRDIETGIVIDRISGRMGRFSSDGKYIVYQDFGTVLTKYPSVEDLISILLKRFGKRELSYEEKRRYFL